MAKLIKKNNPCNFVITSPFSLENKKQKKVSAEKKHKKKIRDRIEQLKAKKQEDDYWSLV